MTFARILLVLQVCSLAGCYHGQGSAEPDADPQVGAGHAADANGDHVARWVLLDDIVNARDLGGVPLGHGQVLEHGVLFRGPRLSMLSPAGCAEFERLGIRTVIDLRIESERSAFPESECVGQSARVVVAPLPIPYDLSPVDYLADLDTTDSIATVFAQLGDASSYPVYVHCTWGRDRTGVLAAVILRALGASRANIMQEYLLSLEKVGAYPESLAAVLDSIEQRGGIESFLRAAGVSDEALATLRTRVILQRTGLGGQ